PSQAFESAPSSLQSVKLSMTINATALTSASMSMNAHSPLFSSMQHYPQYQQQQTPSKQHQQQQQLLYQMQRQQQQQSHYHYQPHHARITHTPGQSRAEPLSTISEGSERERDSRSSHAGLYSALNSTHSHASHHTHSHSLSHSHVYSHPADSEPDRDRDT